MASKRKGQTGLGAPDVEGIEGLFNVSEPVASEQPNKDTSRKPPETQTEEEDEQIERVKTSLYLNQETMDLLHDLKTTARKREGRFVSFGELMDRAVRDLAQKMNLEVKN